MQFVLELMYLFVEAAAAVWCRLIVLLVDGTFLFRRSLGTQRRFGSLRLDIVERNIKSFLIFIHLSAGILQYKIHKQNEFAVFNSNAKMFYLETIQIQRRSCRRRYPIGQLAASDVQLAQIQFLLIVPLLGAAHRVLPLLLWMMRVVGD